MWSEYSCFTFVLKLKLVTPSIDSCVDDEAEGVPRRARKKIVDKSGGRLS